MIKQIVITGPESTGKTTLAEYLSSIYKLPLIKEYAREYLENLSDNYTFEDVLLMAKEQLKQEQKNADKLSICDTDLTVFYVWIKEKYKTEVKWINDNIRSNNNKVYLLCDIDIEWVADPLREHPKKEDRKRLFNAYINLLEQNNLSYHIISGNSKNRLKKSKEIIDKLI